MVSSIAKSLLAAALLSPVFAHAEGSVSGGSQFFYQTEAGKSAVTPEIGTVSTKQKYEGGGKEDQSATALAVSYEYGLMPDLSVGGKIGYVVSGKFDQGTEVDLKGLQDLSLFVKGSTAAGSGHLKYGADLTLSPGDQKLDGDKLNAYTGRHAIAPYIGYQMAMAPCVFGVKLAKEIGLTDGTFDNNGTKTDFSGAEDTTISLFYEHEMSADMRVGASLDWITTSDMKDETNGGKSEEVSPTQNISVYAPMKVGNGELLPSFTYSMSTDDKVNGTKLDSYKGTEINLGYRMTF